MRTPIQRGCRGSSSTEESAKFHWWSVQLVFIKINSTLHTREKSRNLSPSRQNRQRSLDLPYYNIRGSETTPRSLLVICSIPLSSPAQCLAVPVPFLILPLEQAGVWSSCCLSYFLSETFSSYG